MSYRSRQDLKNILVLVTAAYATYQAYLILNEQGKRSAARKKRRMQALARTCIYEGDSSSSDEEYGAGAQVAPVAEPSNKIEHIQIIDPSSIKREKCVSGTNYGKFVESIVSKFSDEQFKKHFRVSRKTVDRLNEHFKSSTEYKNIFKLGEQTKIPANYYIMMFLWFVGKKCSYLELSKVFNVSLSRSVYIVDTVLQFLNNCARDYIRFPETPSERRNCAESFQEIAGFPDVIGCLLNTYIQARVPVQNSSTSSSSHENIASSIQAICDSRGRFLNVFVNATHKVHHTEMLHMSPINEKLKEICQGRFHILADGDYHVREWLQIPYKGPISSGQILYNNKHRNTLEAVSDSLEVLKSRFQQLTNKPSFSTYKIKKMIIACCVVQNMCLEENDCYDIRDPLAVCSSTVKEETVLIDDIIADDIHLRRIGELKRKQIMEELKMK